MYSHILIPILVDAEHNTEASYTAAKALASPGATFTVLHVIEAIPVYVANELPGDVILRSHEEAEQQLKTSAAALPDAKTVLATGHAGNYIVDYAKKHDADCIVMASHRPNLEDFFLGSTASRVVRHARCSVHVIR